MQKDRHVSKDIRNLVDFKQQLEWSHTNNSILVCDIYSSEWGPCKAINDIFIRLKTEIDEIQFCTIECNEILKHITSNGANRSSDTTKMIDSIQIDKCLSYLRERQGKSQPFFLLYNKGKFYYWISGINAPLLKLYLSELNKTKVPASNYITTESLLSFWETYFDSFDSEVSLHLFIEAISTELCLKIPLNTDEIDELGLQLEETKNSLSERIITAEHLQKWYSMTNTSTEDSASEKELVNEKDSLNEISLELRFQNALPNYKIRENLELQPKESIRMTSSISYDLYKPYIDPISNLNKDEQTEKLNNLNDEIMKLQEHLNIENVSIMDSIESYISVNTTFMKTLKGVNTDVPLTLKEVLFSVNNFDHFQIEKENILKSLHSTASFTEELMQYNSNWGAICNAIKLLSQESYNTDTKLENNYVVNLIWAIANISIKNSIDLAYLFQVESTLIDFSFPFQLTTCFKSIYMTLCKDMQEVHLESSVYIHINNEIIEQIKSSFENNQAVILSPLTPLFIKTDVSEHSANFIKINGLQYVTLASTEVDNNDQLGLLSWFVQCNIDYVADNYVLNVTDSFLSDVNEIKAFSDSYNDIIIGINSLISDMINLQSKCITAKILCDFIDKKGKESNLLESKNSECKLSNSLKQLDMINQCMDSNIVSNKSLSMHKNSTMSTINSQVRLSMKNSYHNQNEMTKDNNSANENVQYETKD